jgi:hypothetical protein
MKSTRQEARLIYLGASAADSKKQARRLTGAPDVSLQA